MGLLLKNEEMAGVYPQLTDKAREYICRRSCFSHMEGWI